MLDTLRNAAGTWVAKTLLLLLVLSFGVWGISGQLTQGFNSNTVVTAGKTGVSVNEFRLAYDRQMRVLSQRFGQKITREQARAFGVDQQVVAQLVAGAVLDEQAREMNLGLSKDRLAKLTADDPAFKGPDGRFDRRAFDQVLRSVGMRPEDYLKNREQVATRQQIVEAISDGITIPDTFLKAAALYQGEDRTVEFVAVPIAKVQPVEEPSADTLTAFFESKKAEYGAPEYRKISYVVLDPEAIADPSAITDEQVTRDYEAHKAQYTTHETRKVEQIVFKDKEAAEAAVKRILAGATFDQVAAAEGKKPEDTDLGTVSRDKIADAVIAEAAFGLKENEVSGVVDGKFGPVILRVSAITPESVKPVEEAAAEIRKELALVEANRVLLDVHDSYEDARAGGSTMAEAASRLKLDLKTVDAVDRTGQTPDGTVLKDLPESAVLLKSAFEAEANSENPPLNQGKAGFVWYEVEGVTPARERTLDEVKDKVIADWKEAEAAKRLGEKAAELEKRLKGGEALDVLAGELGLEKQTKRGVKRGSDDPDIGEAGVTAAFSVAQGQTGLVPGPSAASQILFKVTEAFEPAGASAQSIPEAERKRLTGAFADDLLDQLVSRLRGDYKVTIDQGALARALTF
ncbi:MAG: SurA N-terminal domain-containing protein [Notoacmeibacter sp.]|nr:SurA N-terminal domain-containing protein [Notoacmeibacter sp.]MCC0033170.1 SurA N-terminal domain-containing protein [Brucellaceae bacterium]